MLWEGGHNLLGRMRSSAGGRSLNAFVPARLFPSHGGERMPYADTWIVQSASLSMCMDVWSGIRTEGSSDSTAKSL